MQRSKFSYSSGEPLRNYRDVQHLAMSFAQLAQADGEACSQAPGITHHRQRPAARQLQQRLVASQALMRPAAPAASRQAFPSVVRNQREEQDPLIKRQAPRGAGEAPPAAEEDRPARADAGSAAGRCAGGQED